MSTLISGALKASWFILKNGVIPSCEAPMKRCICEKTLYATVGTLALFAGLIMFGVGYYQSMAVFSDSLHILADSAADFVGVYIIYKILVNTEREQELRDKSNKVVAFLLVMGGAVISYEALTRWLSGAYPASAFIAMIAGALGYSINKARLSTLMKASKHFKSENIQGFINHAQGDVVHCQWLTGIAATAWVASEMALMFRIDPTVPQYGVRVLDLCANQVLTVYLFYLGRQTWYGKGCGHDHDGDEEHSHGHKPGEKCTLDHSHDHHGHHH